MATHNVNVQGGEQLDTLASRVNRVSGEFEHLNKQYDQYQTWMREHDDMMRAMQAPTGTVIGPVRGLTMGRQSFVEDITQIDALAKMLRDSQQTFTDFEGSIFRLASTTRRSVQEVIASEQQLAMVRSNQQRAQAIGAASQYGWGTGLQVNEITSFTARMTSAGAFASGAGTPFSQGEYNRFLFGVEEAISRGSKSGYQINRREFLGDVSDLVSRRNVLTGTRGSGIGIAQNLAALQATGNPATYGQAGTSVLKGLNDLMAGGSGVQEGVMWQVLQRAKPGMTYLEFDDERYKGFDTPEKLRALGQVMDEYGFDNSLQGNVMAGRMLGMTPGQMRALRQSISGLDLMQGNTPTANKVRDIFGKEGANQAYMPIGAQLIAGNLNLDEAWKNYTDLSGNRSAMPENIKTPEDLAEYLATRTEIPAGAFADDMEQTRNQAMNRYEEAASNFREAITAVNKISAFLAGATLGASGNPIGQVGLGGLSVLSGIGGSLAGGVGQYLMYKAVSSQFDRWRGVTTAAGTVGHTGQVATGVAGAAHVAQAAQVGVTGAQAVAGAASVASAGAALAPRVGTATTVGGKVAQSAGGIARFMPKSTGGKAAVIGGTVAALAAGGAWLASRNSPKEGPADPLTSEEIRNARTRTREVERQNQLLRRLITIEEGGGAISTDIALQSRYGAGVSTNVPRGIPTLGGGINPTLGGGTGIPSGGGRTGVPNKNFGSPTGSTIQGAIGRYEGAAGGKSPFTGDMFANVSSATGIPAALLFAMTAVESQIGINNDPRLTAANNFGGIKATPDQIAAGNYVDIPGVGKFAKFQSPQDFLMHMAQLLLSDTYSGKSLVDIIGIYLLGPEGYAAGGLDGNDGAGHTVRQYLESVLKLLFDYFGISASPNDVPYTAGPAPTAGNTSAMFDSPIAITQRPYPDSGSHKGKNAVDLAPTGPNRAGVKIFAPAAGKVTDVFTGINTATGGTGYGNYLSVMTDDQYHYLIGHFAPGSLKGLKVGDRIGRGQYLGIMGKTGYVLGDDPTHAHVELLPDSKQNPDVIDWLKSIGALPGGTPDVSGSGGGTGGAEQTRIVLALEPLEIDVRSPRVDNVSLLTTGTSRDGRSGLVNTSIRLVR